MSTAPYLPDSDAVAVHHSETIKRKRSGRRMMWGILIGFVVLLMLAPLVLYLAWQARGRGLLRKELAAVKSLGEPITTAELTAWYAVPAGERDVTAIWQAAIAPFDTATYTASTRGVPIVGDGPELPKLNQPITTEDEQKIRDFLKLYRDQLEALYTAADEQGAVRYPRHFSKGIAMLLPEAQQVRSASRALQLEFEILAREDDLAPAFKNLRMRLDAGETLRHEPVLISMLVRIAVFGNILEDIRRLMEQRTLDDSQLAQLQQLVHMMDIHSQLPDALLGERAWCYHAFHLRTSNSLAPSYDNMVDEGGIETSHDVSKVRRPEDCAMALSLLAEARQGAELPTPEMLKAFGDFEDRITELHGNGSPIHRLRYAMTITLLPAMQAVAIADARSESLRDLTDTSLAARRFHLKHNRWPTALADLVPDFLPAIPIDSYDGQPLRMKSHESSLLLYSVGKDRRDDGGQGDTNKCEPDIVVEMKLAP